MASSKRRAGQSGQIGYQGRSHDTSDCGSYVLIRRTGANEWQVQYTAPCDDSRTSIIKFVSSAKHARYF
jgi:hypothetical protein